MILELLEVTDRLQEVGVIAFVLYSVYRELRWNPYENRDGWRAAGVLGLIGIISLVRTVLPEAGPRDYGLLVLALGIAVVAGALSARAARFRPLSAVVRARIENRPQRRRGGVAQALPRLEVRTGWVGALLWVLALGGRYAVEALAEHAGSALAGGVGMGLLVVAVTEAVRTVCLRRRAPVKAS